MRLALLWCPGQVFVRYVESSYPKMNVDIFLESAMSHIVDIDKTIDLKSIILGAALSNTELVCTW